mgnify:CR=1 FL=1
MFVPDTLREYPVRNWWLTIFSVTTDWLWEFVLEDPVRNVGTTGFARVLTGNNIINSKQSLINLWLSVL